MASLDSLLSFNEVTHSLPIDFILLFPVEFSKFYIEVISFQYNILQCGSCDSTHILLDYQVTYLGHIISMADVAIDPEKIQFVIEWPIPTLDRGVRGVLGLAGYYHSGFDGIAAPLTQLLIREGFVWSPTTTEAFSQLKKP
ncbi:hypothetical protein ACOSQ3_014752 [Xanthoceras sorbifolium]